MPPPLSSLCGRRSASRRRADRNVAVVSHGQYVPALTTAAAWRVNTAVSKAAWWPWPLTLKVVSESRVTWATSVPILVFLDLSVLDLGPMYATDVRQTDKQRRQTESSLYAPAY